MLAAKEALHNVVKHSGASEARVRVVLMADRFELAVSDDGCGFDVPVRDAGSAGGRRRPGRGLGNMAMRLRENGGCCEVTSAPGQGTRVRFVMPLEGDGRSIEDAPAFRETSPELSEGCMN